MKFRLIALLTFITGLAAASYFHVQPDPPARFRVLIPPAPEPITALSVPNCGLLVVTIDRDSRLKLNTEDIGTVDDTRELTERLKEIFQQWIDNRAFNPGMEDRPDLPIEKRVMRIVFVRAPSALRYGQVVKTINVIKAAGADPVGLQLDELPL